MTADRGALTLEDPCRTGTLRVSVRSTNKEGYGMNDIPTKLNTTKARQGKTGVGVRYVLIGSLALVIVVLGFIYMTVH